MNTKGILSLSGGKTDIRLILRLILAIVFALTAFIFSELIPDFQPFNRALLRLGITVWFGLIGFSLFPDVARRVTLTTVSWINLLTARVSTEIMNQIMRLPQGGNVHVPFSHNAPLGGISANQPVILDTSAIIDGRILDIAKTGFISGLMLIPSFILQELQQVADSSDYLKRSRGRRGFEIIDELKKVKGVRVEIWDKEPVAKTVDDKLLKLAKSLSGRIVTTDYNLNMVASVSNVKVLNMNELANSVKTLAIPGETLEIKVIHVGKDATQGVGYLNDGTMVVVENGANLVGKETKIEVTRMIQVAAGRMIFSKKVGNETRSK